MWYFKSFHQLATCPKSNVCDLAFSLGPLWFTGFPFQKVHKFTWALCKGTTITFTSCSLVSIKKTDNPKTYREVVCTYLRTQRRLPVAPWPTTPSVPAQAGPSVSITPLGPLESFRGVPSSSDSWRVLPGVGAQDTTSLLRLLSSPPGEEAADDSSWAWTLDSQSRVNCSQGQQKGARVPSLT